jgi:hypothetical protein
MPVWEYKTITRQGHEMLSDEQLNSMGANGFELLQVLNVTENIMVVGRRETLEKVHYFFKRARPANPQAANPQTAGPQAPRPPLAPQPPVPPKPATPPRPA